MTKAKKAISKASDAKEEQKKDEVITHTVTEQDLENNPDLVGSVKPGEEITIEEVEVPNTENDLQPTTEEAEEPYNSEYELFEPGDVIAYSISGSSSFKKCKIKIEDINDRSKYPADQLLSGKFLTENGFVFSREQNSFTSENGSEYLKQLKSK